MKQRAPKRNKAPAPAKQPVQKKKKPARQPKGLPRWRLILLSLALLGFVVFLCPVFGGILNPVNGAAMLGFLALAAVFLFWPGFVGLLKRIWRRPWSRILLLLSGLGLLILSVVLLVLCCKVTLRLHAVPEQPCPTLTVLGCQVRGTSPSLLLSYRIQAAADYLEAHPQTVAVLSGGQGSGESITEAECMYLSLTALGVDPARLYREDRSTSTEENIRFSKELMEREGLRGPAAIVSNDFHICRALEMAADQGLEAQGLAARSNWYSRPTYILREAAGLLYYWLNS
ncbi:MAG: YdcF family protein [Oscillospiraceae bacterium]|nr:YdcF family protein [Oscillospiraceae bacterium]